MVSNRRGLNPMRLPVSPHAHIFWVIFLFWFRDTHKQNSKSGFPIFWFYCWFKWKPEAQPAVGIIRYNAPNPHLPIFQDLEVTKSPRLLINNCPWLIYFHLNISGCSLFHLTATSTSYPNVALTAPTLFYIFIICWTPARHYLPPVYAHRTTSSISLPYETNTGFPSL